MPAPATTIATSSAAALGPSLFRTTAPPPLPAVAPVRLAAVFALRPLVARRRVSCQVAVPTDLSSAPEVEEEERQAAAKIGKRVRVKGPLKVYHVQKAPELDLDGLEGVIKQYVGVWKGKRISSNLPFKVEFHINVEGQARPVKFLAHLKEDEFEYLPE
ncbi:ferredoxin-thioredoxin reductase, variable chain-like [Canna indica]|uniref:Ferredoxin-thioredoxin reductase, variable chain-like n=1 Tax=Canna indica TaxID=4628 RepID=A0AAQ3QE44_9LILI|nr:ferredoxin-thioredoxin reductase, variable chain-like [Canna indica]